MVNLKAALRCGVIINDHIGQNIYKLVVRSRELARGAAPGRFAMVKCGGGAYLRRPFGFCDADEAAGTATFMYRAGGAGTSQLAQRARGDVLDIVGPLGRGFDIFDGKHAIVCGGTGVFPMLLLAKRLRAQTAAKPDIFAGYRGRESMWLARELAEQADRFTPSTDDGSAGAAGTVADAFRDALDAGAAYDGVYACGPQAMLGALQQICGARGLNAQASLEQRMGCGVGACLACACAVAAGGAAGESNASGVARACKNAGENIFDLGGAAANAAVGDAVGYAGKSASVAACADAVATGGGRGFEYARVCRDGPVFSLGALLFDEM